MGRSSGHSGGSRSSNDDRSDSLNPNNDAYQSSLDNRADQLNPNNERYQGDGSDEGEANDPSKQVDATQGGVKK